MEMKDLHSLTKQPKQKKNCNKNKQKIMHRLSIDFIKIDSSNLSLSPLDLDEDKLQFKNFEIS